MALRDDLLDSAASTAKTYAHENVEPRHVLFAIAKRFRGNAEAGALFDKARAALEPSGSALAKAKVAPEAQAMLEAVNTEQDAVKALVTAFQGGTKPAEGGAVGGQARQSKPEVKVEGVPAGTPQKQENTADILKELEGLVGLGAVKSQVKNVIAVVEANAKRVAANMQPVNPSLHLVFTGPPGTGKTTVARIVARLYAATGALPGAGFNEATRADLIAGYVGQTAIKTVELINRTRPGVLFIDEAYALTPTSGVDFGAEAIATLVKAMEDHRDELAVIVAGYGEEMTDFVGSNPGLRSRFKTYIAFPDYTPAELLKIFELMAKESGIQLADGVLAKAEKVLDEAVGLEDFGNARYVRSLFEMAYARMAARAASDGRVSVSELLVLQPDDIVFEADSLRRERKRIGFGGQEAT